MACSLFLFLFSFNTSFYCWIIFCLNDSVAYQSIFGAFFFYHRGFRVGFACSLRCHYPGSNSLVMRDQEHGVLRLNFLCLLSVGFCKDYILSCVSGKYTPFACANHSQFSAPISTCCGLFASVLDPWRFLYFLKLRNVIKGKNIGRI